MYGNESYLGNKDARTRSNSVLGGHSRHSSVVNAV